MDSSSKDASCYIDGLPLKISPKFYPPRPVALPLTLDTKTSYNLLAEQYDFSLERSVIDFIQKRQAEILEPPQENTEASSDASSSDPPESESVIKPNAQRIPPWQPDSSILQPQQPLDQAPSAVGTTQDIKINLSDFENDTSSPFDYMELQTINDLEELNSVFLGIHNNSDTRTTVQEEEGALPETRSEGALNVGKSVSFPLPQNNTHAVMPSSLSEDFGGKSMLPPLNNNHSSFVSTLASSKGMRDFFCDNSSYSTLSQVPYVASQSTKGMSEKSFSLRGSKSYSDIHSLSDVEMPHAVKERSRTPPTFHPEVSELEVRPLPLNEDYFGSESSNGVCETSAYEELDESAKHFVDCITEMGFVKGQVARAVKHLGTDEKKVVEHLCQIQMLEESGYESSEAEAALHLHDYNRDQAKAFLDLVIRFQDLGFEKDAVKKALVQNKNDWNKTIDALLP